VVEQVVAKLGVSQRQACMVLAQPRSTQRYELRQPEKDRELAVAIRQEAQKRQHRRYGYRRIREILCRLGWRVNPKRIYRLWRLEGLKLRHKRRKRIHGGGNSANACDQRPPEYMNHIWSYDIIEDKLENGRKVRILNVLDEFTKECLASDVGFHVTGHDVVEVLRYLFLVRGCPRYLRSDNGPEFIAEAVKDFLAFSRVDTLYIERGSPWENGYLESFNSRMRDELLAGELFLHLDEVRYLVERWRMDYNHYRPHSSLLYMTPAAYAQLCREVGCVRRYMPIPAESEVRETLSHKLD
jgi:putative transposase